MLATEVAACMFEAMNAKFKSNTEHPLLKACPQQAHQTQIPPRVMGNTSEMMVLLLVLTNFIFNMIYVILL